MALFHFHVTQVKRSAGQSVVTSAAYRAGGRQRSTRPGRAAALYVRRIGNTIFEVSFHFSTTSRETMSDKINRLIRRELDAS